VQVASSPSQRSEHNESIFSDQFSGGDFSDGHRDPMEDDIGHPQPGKPPLPLIQGPGASSIKLFTAIICEFS
jgi:hypothetical protein